MAKMTDAQVVYYGPSTGYPSVGSVSKNEGVDSFWVEGNWCYIRYTVGSSSTKKCGYVLNEKVNHSGETPQISNDNNGGTRYVRDGGKTYTGPGSSGYVEAGSVDAGEAVTYTGYKYNNYALIEYNVGTTGNKKRAWYSANDMTLTPPVTNTFYNYNANGWTTTNPWNGTANHPGHLGLDLVRSSNKEFYALADGKVVANDVDGYPSNGNTIVLEHSIGGKVFYSFYAHMDSAPNLQVGDRVTCGTRINTYGSSGNVTAAHLHLGVYTGSAEDNQYGYYRVNDNPTYFDDGGRGYFDYMGYRFFDPAQVISTNGSIIC